MTAASVLDYRALARRRLPRFLFDYSDGGAYEEVTLRRNRADLEAVELRQRVLTDVSHVDPSVRLFGSDLAMPVALAPVGLAGLHARRGEVQALAAAQAARVGFCLSTMSLCGLDEVAAVASRPFWFQLYVIRDRGFMRALLASAKAAGCTTLFFTVDLPVPGARYRDRRSGLAAPGWRGALARAWQAACRPRWAWDVGVRGRPHALGNLIPVLGADSGLEDYFGWISGNFDPSMTWKHLDLIRAEWDGPIVIKGILDEDDARAALDAGADGLVVSNHGGRQLDGVPSTARALPPIAETVAGRVPVLVDGGVRSGLDVVRMLALGASGVLIGRAWVYALAARGGAGVAHVLDLIEAEMRAAMALTGCTRVADIGRHVLSERR